MKAEQKLISPCVGCPMEGECDYRWCEAYRKFIGRFWNRCRRYARPQQSPRRENVFRYEAPYRVEHYLNHSPCESCPRRDHCHDWETCESHLAWVDARMERIRRRLERG